MSADFERKHEQFRGDFDRGFRRATKLAVAVGVFSTLIGLGVLGVVVWAVIRLVVHFTS